MFDPTKDNPRTADELQQLLDYQDKYDSQFNAWVTIIVCTVLAAFLVFTGIVGG